VNLYLFRHGKTASNERHAYLGNTDEPLSSDGIQKLLVQKKAMADRLPHPNIVYTSDMKRTTQTASILFPEIPQCPIAAFREMDFGVFEGKNFEDLKDDPDYRRWVDSGCTTACPNGESMESFQTRVANGFLKLLDQHPEDPLVFVVHGGTIMALLDTFAVPNTGYFSYQLKNGSWYEGTLSKIADTYRITHLHKQEME
jgi:alpha-ribazole phosphatase